MYDLSTSIDSEENTLKGWKELYCIVEPTVFFLILRIVLKEILNDLKRYGNLPFCNK